MMEQDLSGAVVLVTGAAGDIGAATCRAFAGRGAVVIGADLASRPADHPAAEWHMLDVTSEESWRGLADTVRETRGRLDVLVNNAGIALMARIEDTTLEEWRRTQAVNVEGIFLGTRAATALLRESGAARTGGAAIVNIASGAADRPTAFSAAYCTSKAAVRMFTRVTAIEFGTLNYPVRVNSVHPGVVRSAMMDRILERFAEISGGASVDEIRAAVTAGNPMGRYVEPEEVAEAVVFLASPAARYIHGDAVHVDGGYAAG